MKANIIAKNENEIVLQIKIPLKATLLQTEDSIQESLNAAGCLATEIALAGYDTNGTPIMLNDRKYTSKGQIEKIYQTPYGEVKLPRHVYQCAWGGKTYCPLEKAAKIIVYSTPKFAQMVSAKYAATGGRAVQKDFAENHGRYISRTYIKDISDSVGQIALEKAAEWTYLQPPVPPEHVKVISLGLDGTCLFMAEDGWRQAMVGTIAFWGTQGERLDTIYLATPPEAGKDTFLTGFEREITAIKTLYAAPDYVGIADGAKDNWKFLATHTKCQILDFFHASEYVAQVAESIFSHREKRTQWLTDRCHQLKHEANGARELLDEFIGYRTKKLNKQKRDKLESAITYFTNNQCRMNYSEYVNLKYPIGSGITEAACKVIVKQRLCNSGMKWKQPGAAAVLCLRALNYSSGRWEQLWNKIDRYGV